MNARADARRDAGPPAARPAPAVGGRRYAAPRYAPAPAARSLPAVRVLTGATSAALLLVCAPAGAQTGAADATAAGATAAGACTAATAGPGQRPKATLRAALRCAVNAERSARRLARIRPDRHLGRAARRHARDMVRRGSFAHERPGWTLRGRLDAAGWSGARAAEAIAWDCGRRGSARATLRGWLESGAHRAIELGSYARVGIGLARGTPSAAGCGAAGTWVLDAGA